MNLQTSKHPLGLLLAGVLLSASVQSVCAATLLSDDFTSISSATWTTANTGTANSSANGTLSLNSVQTGNAQRAVLISKGNNFNPFVTGTQSITATFTGLTIGGTPSVGGTNTNGGANAFYAYIGNPTGGTGTGNSYAWGEVGNYLSVSIQNRVTTANVPFTQLGIFDRGSSATSAAVNLSGTPTGFSWTVNGTSMQTSITLTGATFSSAISGFTLSAGNTTMTGNFTNFNSTSLGTGSSFLAIGGMNLSATVTGATTAGLDSILVTAIPEPSTSALFIGFASIAFLIMRSRRKS